MADRSHVGLKSFLISSKAFNLSLSMTSNAFVYHAPFGDPAQNNTLSSLIESKQLWLMPRGHCRLDVYVQLYECDITREGPDEYLEFLELLADIICQSPLWAQLGLEISVLDVQYMPGGDDTPNLYFSIEQPDMSSALLSPPHTHTAQFKGLECILQFKSSMPSQANGEQVDPLPPSPTASPTGVPTGHHTLHIPDLTEQREHVTKLVEAALNVTVGMRKRIPGFSILEREAAPSLLSLAPAIWNSHYLKCAANHAKNFELVSNILASSINGQSPELRRKAAELLSESGGSGHASETAQSVRRLESNIQERLWDLLRATLKTTMGAGNNRRQATSQKIEFNRQDNEIDEVMVDHGDGLNPDSPYEMHYIHGDMFLTSSHALDEYPINAYDDSSMEYVWQDVDNESALFVEDPELYEAYGPADEMDLSYTEADMYLSQLVQFDSPQYRDWFYDDGMNDFHYAFTDEYHLTDSSMWDADERE